MHGFSERDSIMRSADASGAATAASQSSELESEKRMVGGRLNGRSECRGEPQTGS